VFFPSHLLFIHFVSNISFLRPPEPIQAADVETIRFMRMV